MTRILLVCPEPLGHRQPAGVGVRFLEMARVLRADGHSVAVMSPDAGAVDGCRAAPFTSDAIQRETARAEMAVVQGHAANELFAHGRALPTVVDLYDPFIVENLHYYAQRGAEVFAHDHATVVNSIVNGDFFLCASTAQRFFYTGLLLAAGRVNPSLFAKDPQLKDLVAIAPFGVNPPRGNTRGRSSSSSGAILFGGIYDWYDPVLAIDAVAEARKMRPDLTLSFTRHPNPATTPQGKAAEAMSYVEERRYGSFVRFEPWVPYDDRAAFFDRYEMALLTFPQSLETDLSMRTRIYDYLWSGLPVITNSAPGTDEILHRYHAGAVVPSGNASALAAEILSVLGDATRRAEYAAGAVRFVLDHQWPDVLKPLRMFCSHPRIDTTKETFSIRLQVPDQPSSILARLRRRIGGAL